jgi:hypothetical protein
MKLEAKEFDGSSHRRLITETKKDIGLLYLGVDGYRYYEPNNDLGVWTSASLREVADFLDEINKPFDELVKKDLGVEATPNLILDEIGGKVKIWDIGYMYTTYTKMFHKLGFKKPEECKAFPKGKKESLENTIFTIFNIGVHDYSSTKLYAIVDAEGNQYLLSKRGLEFL